MRSNCNCQYWKAFSVIDIGQSRSHIVWQMSTQSIERMPGMQIRDNWLIQKSIIIWFELTCVFCYSTTFTFAIVTKKRISHSTPFSII